MTVLSKLGIAMAGILVGLGVAVFAKAVATVGFDRLVLGHIVGPGLVAAGLMRIRLQRMMATPPTGEDDATGGAPDGRTS